MKKTKFQLRNKNKALADCKRKLKATKGISLGLKANNKDLQAFLTVSREELSKCKDDLFSLQRVTQIPDSTIFKRFESIGQQSVHWIDAETAAFETAHPEAELEDVFSVGRDKKATKFLRLYPDAGEHLARYLIHRFLQKNVFGKRIYLFGLPEETANLLQVAELRMAELDPPRGTKLWLL